VTNIIRMIKYIGDTLAQSGILSPFGEYITIGNIIVEKMRIIKIIKPM